MGDLGATLTLVFTLLFTRALGRGERVTQGCPKRWETGIASANDVTHRKRAEDFGNLKKSHSVELRPASEEDRWLSLARGGLGQVSHGWGQMRKPE